MTLPGGTTEYRHYIPGGNGTAAIHTRRSTGTNSTYYWHADHLGSPELFTDTGATALVRPSFGAFGERRDGTDWVGPPSAADLTTLAGITRRGFTGHEHLDSVGLIHMNGRVYDPGAARFLAADPILNVGWSQDANRYSYAWNNPLLVTDPTGFDDDPTPVQCIGADFCPGSIPPPQGAFEDVEVIGQRVDTPIGGWGSASGNDLANQLASWGSGIDLAIDLGNGMERQFAGPDGEVTVTATRLGRTFGPVSYLAGGIEVDDSDDELFCLSARQISVISGAVGGMIAGGIGGASYGGLQGALAGAAIGTLFGGGFAYFNPSGPGLSAAIGAATGLSQGIVSSPSGIGGALAGGIVGAGTTTELQSRGYSAAVSTIGGGAAGSAAGGFAASMLAARGPYGILANTGLGALAGVAAAVSQAGAAEMLMALNDPSCL